MTLSDFEHRLLSRNIVSAVAVQENESREAVRDEILQQPAQQIEIHPRRRRHRACEVEVVIGVAQPLQRRKDDAVVNSFCGPTRDFTQQQTVREQRQMMSVLFERGNREDDRRGFVERRNGGPGQIGEMHE